MPGYRSRGGIKSRGVGEEESGRGEGWRIEGKEKGGGAKKARQKERRGGRKERWKEG